MRIDLIIFLISNVCVITKKAVILFQKPKKISIFINQSIYMIRLLLLNCLGELAIYYMQLLRMDSTAYNADILSLMS